MEQILDLMAIALLIGGFCLVYFYGISPRFKKGNATGFYSAEKITSDTKEGIRKEKKYKRNSDLGFAMTILGMVLQGVVLYFFDFL